MIRVTFTNRAIDDLDAINAYRSAYSPAYADHLIDAIIAKIDRLKTFPKMGRTVPEFGLSYLRELIHDDYRIVYKIVDSNQVDVITIQHSSRNMEQRFFDVETLIQRNPAGAGRHREAVKL